MGTRTRILIADDHAIVREGLRALLQGADHDVVGETGNGIDTLALVEELRPDLAIVDVNLPGLPGAEVTRKLKAGWPEVKVLALLMYGDRMHVVQMLQAGVDGYLIKDTAFKELQTAIRAVMAGERFLGGGLPADVVDYLSPETAPRPKRPLTPRERQVLQLIAEGLINKEIAAKLGMSPRTTEIHRAQLMAKLGLHSVAELTKYAIREGLTSVEQ